MTTAATPLHTLDQSFYVPDFEVKIAGRELPQEVVQDVLSVSYKDNVTEIDSFELVINNWDAASGSLKYLPASDPRFEELFHPDLDKPIQVRMGYAGDLTLMLTGVITSLEPRFPAGGGPTLTVRGLNQLHRFRTEQHTRAWTDKRDSDIARELGNLPLRKGKAGLGRQVDINPAEHEVAEEYVLMDNQYDIVFLLERARRHGYEFVLREGEEEGDDPTLYFGPSEAGNETPTYQLEWGKSLVSFQPTLTTANQISEVVVRGWNRRSNRKIEGKAKWEDLYPRRSPERQRMATLAKAFGSKSEIITNRPVHTPGQAKALAKDILRRRLKGMVTASGKTLGLPNVRASRRVDIVGFDSLFSGMYYVTESTHTIGDSGYQTQFKARREDEAQREEDANG